MNRISTVTSHNWTTFLLTMLQLQNDNSADIEAIIKPSDTALARRYPARQGDSRTKKEIDDIFDILTVLDERLILSRLPSYVTDSSDKLPSVKLDDGDLFFMLAKLDKMEALINNLQSTLQSVYAKLPATSSQPTAGPAPVVARGSRYRLIE